MEYYELEKKNYFWFVTNFWIIFKSLHSTIFLDLKEFITSKAQIKILLSKAEIQVLNFDYKL